MATVKIMYFKPSGKYYSSGEYETVHDALYRVLSEVEEMFKAGNNPGLIDFAMQRNRFDAVVEVFDVPHLFRSGEFQ